MGKMKVISIGELRAKVENLVDPYFKYEGNIPEEDKDSGQLKFYKDTLLVRNLALSTNSEVRFPKNRVHDFLKENIMVTKQECKDFVDPVANLDAYSKSIYAISTTTDKDGKTDKYTYVPKKGFSMFLLLEKAQSVVFEKFCTFYEDDMRDIPEEYEEEDEEKDKEKDKVKRTDKQLKYIDFLHSVAIYEIFILEYAKKIEKLHQGDSNPQKVQEEKEETSDLTEWVEQNIPNLGAILETDYYGFHLMNLFAILKLVYTLEFVQSNNGWDEPTKMSDKITVEEVKRWKRSFRDVLLFCSEYDVYREK